MMSDAFEEMLAEQFEADEPYALFRERVLNVMARTEWVLRFSDSEADFYSKGRWVLHTWPPDPLWGFQSISVFEYRTVGDAETWAAGKDVEPIEVTSEYTIEDALRYVESRSNHLPARPRHLKGMW